MFPPHARLPSGLSIAMLALCQCTALLHGDERASTPINGQHVLIIGNSFQGFVDHHMALMARAAGIDEHLRGGDPLAARKVDVVAINPWFKVYDKPDEGLNNLVEKALKHNANIRVLAQVGWLPYDEPQFPVNEQQQPKTNWSARPLAEVRKIHEPFRKNAADQVRAINEQHGRTIVYVVPVAEAVLTLREKIAAGEVPALTSQDDLFNDSIGHARPPIELLNAYCHYAVVYRRSPVGLKITDSLDEKLHAALQAIAWDAVLGEPLSGVQR